MEKREVFMMMMMMMMMMTWILILMVAVLDPCLSNTCGEHTTCYGVGEGYECLCNRGWEGDGFSCTGQLVLLSIMLTILNF